MKIALYIEDGLEQIVLTPEGEYETNMLAKMTDGSRIMEIHQGEFYNCRGGWLRQGPGDKSTIVRLLPKPVPVPLEE